ncbi:MAG: hypothetical protein WD830_12425 [Chloroflexota bacterium]
MEAMLLILVAFAVVALVGAAAQTFGADSRDKKSNFNTTLGVR